MASYVEYAISLGIFEREGMWRIQYVDPVDAGVRRVAYIPPSDKDGRIGKKIDGIPVAKPGPRMMQVLAWLQNQVTKYPYFWPYEGGPVDRYGYDFEVTITNGDTQYVEITTIAYEIVRTRLDVKDPVPTEKTIEVDEYLPAGGAYVKLAVTLQAPQPVSEITITPFTVYPLEVVSVLYEEDIETYRPRKEIIFQQKPQPSTKTIVLTFPTIIAKRITIILCQKNYTINKYLIRESEVHKKELWDKISLREAEVTLDVNDNGLETVEESNIMKWTGWDAYLKAYEKYKKDLDEWKKAMEEYKKKMDERLAKIKEAEEAEKNYNKAMSKWRAEYEQAKKKYNQKVKQYEDQLELYQRKKKEYEKQLAAYKRYLRELEEWKRKWGK